VYRYCSTGTERGPIEKKQQEGGPFANPALKKGASAVNSHPKGGLLQIGNQIWGPFANWRGPIAKFSY
jgi:hypothetical protein